MPSPEEILAKALRIKYYVSQAETARELYESTKVFNKRYPGFWAYSPPSYRHWSLRPRRKRRRKRRSPGYRPNASYR